MIKLLRFLVGWWGAITVVAPSRRSFIVVAETRRFIVVAETRRFTVPIV